MKKLLSFAIANCLMLFACMTESTPPPDSVNTGTAKVKLPVVPKEMLAKIGAASTSPLHPLGALPDFYFQINITGPGMDMMSKFWSARDFSGQTVTIDGIPAGSNRQFTGQIWQGGKKTHEGSSYADVHGGQTAYVPILLRDVGTGNAEICMEVEGWPGDSTCVPLDTIPHDTASLLGCWHFKIMTNPAAFIYNPYDGEMTLSGSDDNLVGTLNNKDGSNYSVSGRRVEHGWGLTLRQIDYIVMMDEQAAVKKITGSMPVDTTVPNIMIPPYGPPVQGAADYVLVDSLGFSSGYPNRVFMGFETDSTFQVRRFSNRAEGIEIFCPAPPDTNWAVDTSWAPDTGLIPVDPYPMPRDTIFPSPRIIPFDTIIPIMYQGVK